MVNVCFLDMIIDTHTSMMLNFRNKFVKFFRNWLIPTRSAFRIELSKTKSQEQF